MEIIALSGFARSGKDEAAKVLVEELGFVRVAFADKLREVLYALNPIVSGSLMLPTNDVWVDEQLSKALATEGNIKVQDVIHSYGWDGYKESQFGAEIRRLLQRLGTEAGRQTLWDSIWIDAALTGLPEDARVVVTDVRFPNEAQAIKDRDGIVWRVERPGVGPANSHPSETSLDDWPFDAWIGNTGTLDDFREAVVAGYHWTLGEKSV